MDLQKIRIAKRINDIHQQEMTRGARFGMQSQRNACQQE